MTGQKRRARGRSARRWIAGAAAVVGVAGSVALGLGFARFMAAIDRVERDPAGAADAIVALTGGPQRIEDAVDLLARGFGQRLLITGVNERTTRDALARLNPADRPLLDCCVDLDYRAQNTLGNAAETGRWTRRNGFRSLIVVTSNYHMPRALAEFGRALPGVTVLPHPVVAGDPDPRRAGLPAARLLVGEYLKYVGSFVRTALTGPAPRTEAAGRYAARFPVAEGGGRADLLAERGNAR